MNNPKLILVGAGPGAIDLITLRGVEAIRNADVILYDALVNAELLKYARPGADIRFVGKRAGVHSLRQGEINQMIVAIAHEKGVVVRLKGGDPFVFGRGYEEIQYASEHGLEVEVVPGISSAFAVPALQGIPVTHRGVSRSVRIISATTEEESSSVELNTLLNADETVVIFMGFNRLKEIVANYHSNGFSELPIAVIQSGTTATERIAIGTIENILEEVETQQLSTPALIVIGEVVRLHPSFKNTPSYV